MMIVFVCVCLFLALPIQSMEQLDSTFVQVKTERDFVLFAGKIVGYKFTDIDSLKNKCSACFAELNSNSLSYGYVVPSVIFGYLIGYKLIQITEKGVPGFCNILCRTHTQKGLIIRCANSEEIVTHHKGIRNNDATVIYIDRVKMLEELEKQSGFELKKKKIA